MWEFLKRLYYEAYDLPHFYLGFEDELFCHVFTIFFILALILSFLYIGRLVFGTKKSRREKKRRKLEMEKHLLRMFDEKNKNKGNI